jgi:agmatinase
MKVSLRLLTALLPAIAGLVSACGHDHHSDREFTPEELAELERKWGMEVWS